MLTGDKLETATCIAKSSRLVSRTQDLYIFAPVATRTEAHQQLNTFRKKQDCALVITGDSLEVIIGFFIKETDLKNRTKSSKCFQCVSIDGKNRFKLKIVLESREQILFIDAKFYLFYITSSCGN